MQGHDTCHDQPHDVDGQLQRRTPDAVPRSEGGSSTDVADPQSDKR